MNPNEIICQVLDIAIETKLWPNKKPSDILKIIMYVYGKGWLYTPSVNGKVTAVICAYRIKEGDSLSKMPLKEEGTILYVPFAISLTDQNLFKVIRQSINLYVSENPDITELILEDKNNQIKRYNLKGAVNEQGRRPSVTSHANLSN